MGGLKYIMSTNEVKVYTSQLAKALLLLKGQPLSLDDYTPMKEIYDCDPDRLTVKASRQIGKSLAVASILTLKAVSIPYSTSIYIAPLSTQSSRFSTSYLDPHLNSPLIKKYFRDTSSKKNVFEKTLSNGSVIYLSYAETAQDADRTRGIPGDLLFIDEIQDVQYDTIGVIAEALSASKLGYKKHFGTAKTEHNTLEVLFRQSNGLEWCIKCTHCGRWNIPNNHDTCIKICSGSEGPVCEHCSKPIDVRKGKWIAARQDQKNHYGFHVPRFIIPERCKPKHWKDIHEKIEAYKPSLLDNEVFGLASGIAGRILSQREAMLCCSTRTSFDKSWPVDQRGICSVVLGVDWSVTAGDASYTVISVLGYDYMGKCYVLHSERLNGVDILDQVRRVEQLALQYNVRMVGSDRGCGQLQFELLRKSLGADRIIPIQYCAAKLPLRYDKQGGFMAADRSQVMDEVFLKMKLGNQKFETPCWEMMANFWTDALAIYEEESISGRRLYRKDEASTDDWFHSIVFGHIAWKIISGQIEMTDMLPYTQEEESGFPFYDQGGFHGGHNPFA